MEYNCRLFYAHCIPYICCLADHSGHSVLMHVLMNSVKIHMYTEKRPPKCIKNGMITAHFSDLLLLKVVSSAFEAAAVVLEAFLVLLQQSACQKTSQARAKICSFKMLLQ